MSIWSLAAGALLVGMVPCAAVIVRAGILDALVALQLAGVIVTLVLLLDGRPAPPTDARAPEVGTSSVLYTLL